MFLLMQLLWCLPMTFGKYEPHVRSVSTAVIHGEGPHWDEDVQVLYFVDIINQTINKYDPKTRELHQVYIDGGPVTVVVPARCNNDLVIGRGRDIVRVNWNGRSRTPSEITLLASVEEDKPENRFNDGKADSSGRLWVGTMGPEKPDIIPDQGSLYSFEPTQKFKPVKHLSPVSISNGLAWNSNDTLMYYIDTPSRKVDVFDFDLIRGSIENRRTLFSFHDFNISGYPDGMAIDEEDNIWVAVYNGASVLHIDTAQGVLLNRIVFPVSKVTSCTFGGPQMDTLYVTTSRRGLSDAQLRKEPEAGSLFEVTNIGVRGQIKPNKVLLT